METYRPDRNKQIPHQNFVNLYFRKAWQSIKTNQYPNMDKGEVYQMHLLSLKKRFGENFNWQDQWYWDLLWLVNERGLSLSDAIQKLYVEAIDPEKEQWIKNQIHNPDKNFHGIYFFYGDKK